MRGDGEVCQGKREAYAGCLQKGFLARPAGEEARSAEMGGQGAKFGAFGKGEKTLRQGSYVDVLADFFDVYAQLATTADRNESCARRVGYVELQSARILAGRCIGLAVGLVFEENFCGWNRQVGGK